MIMQLVINKTYILIYKKFTFASKQKKKQSRIKINNNQPTYPDLGNHKIKGHFDQIISQRNPCYFLQLPLIFLNKNLNECNNLPITQESIRAHGSNGFEHPTPHSGGLKACLHNHTMKIQPVDGKIPEASRSSSTH